MRVFGDFILAVIEEWKGWLTGSLPMALIAAIALIRPDIAPLPILAWVLLVFVAGFASASFRVYRKIKLKLDAISVKRPFMFKTIKVVAAGPFGSITENNYHFLITLIFENRGDEMINFMMHTAYAEINGRRSPQGDFFNKGRYVHPREEFSFSLSRIDSVSTRAFPIYFDIFFDAKYDNVPPLKERGSLRKIKYVCNNLSNPEEWTNFVIEQNET